MLLLPPYMGRFLFLLLLLSITTRCAHTTRLTSTTMFTIPFEQNPNQTVTYAEAIACYEQMAAAHPAIFHLRTVGSTDSGEPLHIAVLSTDGQFEPAAIRRAGKRILLINNGIHPGEPEGIDATILLLRDLLTKPERRKVLEHLVLVVIPVYNIDGCLNRGSYSRVNQDGPEAYGFRANARNYDLNRDFIKCDSRNARAFNEIFTHWQPDVFVDNHTSNGADYQYVMTLIATLYSKLEAPLGDFLSRTMLPRLYGDMKQRGWEMIPYVDSPTDTPDSGIINFCDYGRFSTGYAAMWNTIGFMPETHMLKPFKDRLWSTYAFMEVVIAFIHDHHEALGKARQAAFAHTRSKEEFVLDWKMDASRHDSIQFKGYAAKYKPSAVSGLPRLWYDRSEPYTKTIPYYNYFLPALKVQKPVAYILPKAWEHVVARLELNGVRMQQLTAAVEVPVESYFIGEFTNREAWEGHYYHSKVKVSQKVHKRTFQKGDYVIYVNQDANRYIVETLEPQAPDSWFAWNFFDPILMQKEGFSAYVFEDLAEKFLQENPSIRQALEMKKAAEPDFAANAALQLNWVYKQSPWYEPTHRRYPVARLMENVQLPLTPLH